MPNDWLVYNHNTGLQACWTSLRNLLQSRRVTNVRTAGNAFPGASCWYSIGASTQESDPIRARTVGDNSHSAAIGAHTRSCTSQPAGQSMPVQVAARRLLLAPP